MRTMMLLSQYGEKVQEEILKRLPAPAEMLKVAFIFTARIPDLEKDPTHPHNDKNLMLKAGFQVEDYDLSEKTYEQARIDLQKFDIIYVAGGNTFFLLKTMHECNFAQIIRELLEEGVAYIGESAGSIVAGPDIYPSAWGWNEVQFDLKDLTGLYLVDFGIVPHFKDKMTEKMAKGIMMAPYKVQFLHDNEFFYIRDDKVEKIKA